METYFNLWTGKMQVAKQWLFAVAIREDASCDLGDGKRLGLEYGCVSLPKVRLVDAEANLRAFETKWPTIQGKLEIVSLPCAFARRDSWRRVNAARQGVRP